jgi:hypothetical protein
MLNKRTRQIINGYELLITVINISWFYGCTSRAYYNSHKDRWGGILVLEHAFLCISAVISA